MIWNMNRSLQNKKPLGLLYLYMKQQFLNITKISTVIVEQIKELYH